MTDQSDEMFLNLMSFTSLLAVMRIIAETLMGSLV